jgi:hypothetical protein
LDQVIWKIIFQKLGLSLPALELAVVDVETIMPMNSTRLEWMTRWLPQSEL